MRINTYIKIDQAQCKTPGGERPVYVLIINKELLLILQSMNRNCYRCDTSSDHEALVTKTQLLLTAESLREKEKERTGFLSGRNKRS